MSPCSEERRALLGLPITVEQSARVFTAKGLLLGEDRPDDDRCTGCQAASCEPCRQVSA